MKSPSIRLVTLNIAHGRGLSPYQGLVTTNGLLRQLGRIGRLLKRLAPDIVCLQEVDEGSHWNRYLNLLEPIREAAGLPYAFLGVHNRRHGTRSLAYGNAILSRIPILSAEAVAFGNKTLGEKGFVYAEIGQAGAMALPLVNLHLDFRSRATRVRQIEHLSRFIKEMHGERRDRPAPVICGDFNARRSNRRDAVLQLFEDLQQRGHYSIHPRSGLTFPSLLPVRGLDFVLLPESMQCLESRVVRTYVSDHRPVLVEFTFGAPA